MYNSLRSTCSSFHLYIFAFDDKCYDALMALELEHVTVIPLKEFEDVDLLKVKSTRSKGEYCWTCTPSTIQYCITHFKISHCTYIDADLYFFSDPKVLVDEMGSSSVLITSHRYTPQYDQNDTCGIYCVQFVTFKNDEHGLKVLNWWREACLDWCYARAEKGKYGDQKYLDTWPTQFLGIHELKHLGGGIAPWNVQQYQFREHASNLDGIEKTTGNIFPVVFYHFHGLKLLKNNRVDLCEYQLASSVIDIIYKPYLKEIKNLKESLFAKEFTINLEYNYNPKINLRQIYLFIRRIINKEYNVYKFNKLIKL